MLNTILLNAVGEIYFILMKINWGIRRILMEQKLLFLFPGQGSHFLGMGKEFLENGITYYSELIEIASDVSKIDLIKYTKEEISEGFTKSEVLQPLIVSISLTYLKLLQDEGITPSAVMGHSLGEITALSAAGAYSPEFAMEMATVRGRFMDMSADACGGGGMAAVMFTSVDDVEEAINKYKLDESIYIANYNAINQIVVSGKSSALKIFIENFSKDYSGKVQQIDVSGPWHTPFIEVGKKEYEKWIENRLIKTPNKDILLNSTAKLLTDTDDIKLTTANQLVKPVLWAKSLHTAAEYFAGYSIIEVGPGKILSGLLRANGVKKEFGKSYNVMNFETLNKTLTKIK